MKVERRERRVELGCRMSEGRRGRLGVGASGSRVVVELIERVVRRVSRRGFAADFGRGDTRFGRLVAVSQRGERLGEDVGGVVGGKARRRFLGRQT